MYSGAALRSMLGETVSGALEPGLIPVDRIMQRWAVANGTGLPSDRWDDNPRHSKVPPLDDDSAIVVERLVLSCPEKTRVLLQKWYGTPEPASVIAERLGMSRRSLYTGWRLSLNFMRFKIEGSRHLTLLRLLHVRAI